MRPFSYSKIWHLISEKRIKKRKNEIDRIFKRDSKILSWTKIKESRFENLLDYSSSRLNFLRKMNKFSKPVLCLDFEAVL